LAWTALQVVLAVAAAIVAYELVRQAVVGFVRRRQERRVDRFLRENKIPDDPFRHTHRVVVKERVLGDPELVAAMLERAKADVTDVAVVEAKVQEWLDEIVPQFNILAYYQVGYRLGRIFAYSLYHVRVDRASLEAAMAKVPPGAAIVLVSNHRSNADYVVTGFMLSRSVQVSYAVGEWARVWPLEGLFKSFGSYFVRRGETDPLYHRTLRSYVELITKQGVTQAIFPEGGLSRDGRLRPPKLGLLDSMVLAKRDPTFTRPLAFVPVGINFDRVLEDEVLVRETVAGDHPLRRRSLPRKVWRVLALAGKVLWGVPVNIVRFATRRLKRHGICAIHFGEPYTLDDWLKENPQVLAEQDRHARHAQLRPLADELMARIAASIPATPVTVVAAAMTRFGLVRMDQGVEAGDMKAKIRTVLDELSLRGTAMFTHNPYTLQAERRRLDEEDRRHDLDPVDLDLADEEALHSALEGALDVMTARGLLVQEGTRLRTFPEKWPLVEYYANSLVGNTPPANGDPAKKGERPGEAPLSIVPAPADPLASPIIAEVVPAPSPEAVSPSADTATSAPAPEPAASAPTPEPATSPPTPDPAGSPRAPDPAASRPGEGPAEETVSQPL
jgi:glycerol-3-phosphate O-acyltransferase